MNLKKVLFTTDFSPTSDTALEWAAALARAAGATLIVAHVAEPHTEYGQGVRYCGPLDLDVLRVRKLLRDIRPKIQGVRCAYELLAGHPAAAIVQYAQMENVDLIVMATHGRTGLKRFLFGSVAEDVVRRALCPVLTLHASAFSPAVGGVREHGFNAPAAAASEIRQAKPAATDQPPANG